MKILIFFMLFKKSELLYSFHYHVYGFRAVSPWLTKNLYFVWTCIVELLLVLCIKILDVFKLSNIFSTPFTHQTIFRKRRSNCDMFNQQKTFKWIKTDM